MTAAYWVFIVFISPVLLVVVCAYLAWEAFRESQGVELDEGHDGKVRDGRGEENDWRGDPEDWKGRR